LKIKGLLTFTFFVCSVAPSVLVCYYFTPRFDIITL